MNVPSVVDAQMLQRLRRVGWALIAVGIVDIAFMIYAIASGWSYSSSFNIFAVIGGVFLLRGSLRAASIIAGFAAFLFAGFSGLPAAIALLYPPDLLRTYLRITPAFSLVGSLVFAAAVLGFLWWVYRSLTAPDLRAAMKSLPTRRRAFWRRPEHGFVVGAGLLMVLLIALLSFGGGAHAVEALRRARELRGPAFRYHVTGLSSSSSSNSGTQVRATVVAYTDTTVETLKVEWRE